MVNKKIEKYIWSVIKEYQPILLLDRNTVHLKYKKDLTKAVMTADFRYPYLDVVISYGNELIEKYKTGQYIKDYIVHELCHTITDPLYSKAVSRYVTLDEIADERELLTDLISNIVIKLHTGRSRMTVRK